MGFREPHRQRQLGVPISAANSATFRKVLDSSLVLVLRFYRRFRSGRIRTWLYVYCSLRVRDWRVARDLEERIQQLCSRIVATDDDRELNRLCVELQQALSEHIHGIREQVAAYRASSRKSSPKRGEPKGCSTKNPKDE